MSRPENKGNNVEEDTKRIWNSLCHASALSMLLLQGNKIGEESARRNLELSKYVVKVLQDPVLVGGFALSIVKAAAKFLAEFGEEEELREESVKYVKIVLKRIREVQVQPSSAEEFENEFGTWLLLIINTILAVQAMPLKEYKQRIRESGLFLNAGTCSPLDFAHIGLVLHRWSFNRLFHSLPAEAFSPESVRDLLKRLLIYEAQYHPELNEALKILD